MSELTTMKIIGQFGIGVNLAQNQFGTKSVKESIWHQSQSEEGTVFVLCLGVLTGPREGETFLILDFYCQYLRRVLFVLGLGAPTGPGEFCQILLLYHVQSN